VSHRPEALGAVYGLLSFKVDEAAEPIRILDILWMG
jgi:hypothetical protein